MSDQRHTIQNNAEGEMKGRDTFNEELSKEMARRTDKMLDNTIDVAVRLKQAREFMAWSCTHIRGSWLDWMDQVGKASGDISSTRMHFDRETKSIIGSAKDITAFFNSEEYSKALISLRDTIALLEKFGELKSNGTLDAFADFILKVSCK